MKINNRYTWETDDIEKAMFDKILIIDDATEQAWIESQERHTHKILGDIPHEKDWKVLDIGCGIGRMMSTFSDKFKQIDGVDFSESMIEFSKDYLKDYKNCNTYLNNGYDLSQLEDNSYDLVYSIITFQHISKDLVNSYIKEILRVLKDSKYISLQFVRPSMNIMNNWGLMKGHDFENDSELLELFKDFDINYQLDNKWAWIKGNKNELN